MKAIIKSKPIVISIFLGREKYFRINKYPIVIKGIENNGWQENADLKSNRIAYNIAAVSPHPGHSIPKISRIGHWYIITIAINKAAFNVFSINLFIYIDLYFCYGILIHYNSFMEFCQAFCGI